MSTSDHKLEVNKLLINDADLNRKKSIFYIKSDLL